MLMRTILSATVLASSILGESTTPKCSTKHIQFPTIPGVKLLFKTAEPVKHYPIEATTTQSSAKWNATLDICNITVTYGHEGWGDKINVHVWLPLQGWNGRMVGGGGGGFSGISNFTRMAPNSLLGCAEKEDLNLRDFYRYFHAPGAAHCGGGVGLVPDDSFSALVDWVEKGVAPEVLPATSTDGALHRNLCQFPIVPAYKKGDHTKASSFKFQMAYD
ncbi:hypothetical protein ACJ41O_012402 [Fusarium nematophilum]